MEIKEREARGEIVMEAIALNVDASKVAPTAQAGFKDVYSSSCAKQKLKVLSEKPCFSPSNNLFHDFSLGKKDCLSGEVS
ncbi:hypothetical protein Pyn_00386 [Prunus yedoensis var. nudiflora]|uniref:Uncharacterized protein n=1 Tax=Prunus yedoensis var. nudiflora TaxID=2094558 RepID=A0A314Z8A6_PRUYE|nr:hypothetical protein Pyn_00386 [Prunus yedoensis var. nudiflora]